MKRLLLTIALPAALLLPVKSQPQILQSLPEREAEEQQLREEISERENRIARRLDEINRQAEEQSRRISQYFSNLDLSRGNRQQGQLAAGGLQFSTSAPAHNPGKSSAAAQKAARKSQRDAEHRAWIEEKRERQREANRRRRENERRRAEAEARMREEIRQRVTAAEYMREGARTERLSSEARYRTGEGAVMMNRMHSSHNLMNANTEKHFGQGNATAGRHRIRKLNSRRPDGVAPGAIPWGTMRQNALTWDRWQQEVKASVITPEIPEPEVKITSQEQWRRLAEEIPEHRFKMIKAVIYGTNNGIFPEIHKVPGSGLYILDMKDDNKLMTLSADGETLDIVTFSDKDFSWKEIKDNLRKSSISVEAGILNKKHSLEVKPFENNNNVSTSVTLNTGQASINTNLEPGGTGDITVAANNSEKVKLFEKASANTGLEIKEERDLASIEFKEKLKLLDWTASVHRQTYSFSSVPLAGQIATGQSWKVKGGIEAGVEAKLSAKASMSILKTEGNISAKMTFAEGGLNATVVHKVPFYDGFCFSEVGGEAKLGYEYTLRESIATTKNPGVNVSAQKQMGSLPISFGVKAKVFRYVSMEEIDKAFNKAMETN